MARMNRKEAYLAINTLSGDLICQLRKIAAGNEKRATLLSAFGFANDIQNIRLKKSDLQLKPVQYRRLVTDKVLGLQNSEQKGQAELTSEDGVVSAWLEILSLAWSQNALSLSLFEAVICHSVTVYHHGSHS